MLQFNYELTQKIMELENWEKEKAKCKLIEISKGDGVYTFDSSQDPTIPSHCICKNRYSDKKASIFDSVYIHIFPLFSILPQPSPQTIRLSCQ